MQRRQLIALLGSTLLTWPFTARAQRSDGTRHVGVLLALKLDDPEGNARLIAFRSGLAKLGWNEGSNIHIEYRWTAGDPELARVYAAELVALKSEVILAAPTSIAATLRRETQSVPIIFAQVADPVGAGLVASLARPGGNMTGFAHLEFPIGAKWLELLKEMVPNVTRVAILFDRGNQASTGYLPPMEAAARALGAQIYPKAVHNAIEIEDAINGFAREANGALVLIPGPFMGIHRDLVISLANRHRLPTVYAFRYLPVSGGLASYGVDIVDLYRSAASYVDRVLKGENPAEMPVQHPSKFELVINLRTAKALGLIIPPTLLARADEVIE